MSILRKVNLEPDIPDLPFYSLSYKKPGLPDYTGHFFRIITRPIMKVEYIAFLLAGRQGSGKTTFIGWTAEKIRKHYKPENCNIVGNKYGNLDVLMDHIDARPIQVIVCDDAYGNLPKDLNRKFTRIRHVFEERLKEAGQPLRGVIYAFYAVQDYFQLEPRIRRTVNGTVFKSSVLNPYDKTLFKRILEEEGFSKLEEIDFKILYSYDHTARSMNIITLQGLNRPGYIVSGVPKDPNIIEWVERTETYEPENETEEPGRWKVEFLESKVDPDFLHEILEVLNVSKRDREIFQAYLEGDSSREISRRYRITDRRIRQIIYEIREEKLGYAAEKAYHNRYPHLEHGGENSPLPDFIDHENRTVISFKAYINPEIGEGSGRYLSKRVGRKEQEYAEKHGYTLHLLVYELTKQRWTRWRLYPTPPLFRRGPLGAAAAENTAQEKG